MDLNAGVRTRVAHPAFLPPGTGRVPAMAKDQAPDLPERGTPTPHPRDGALPVPSTLRMPEFVRWPNFPFDGDLRLRPLDQPAAEPPRAGEGGVACQPCAAADEDYIWVDDRWRLRAIGPTGLPVVLMLETRSHLDLGDLSRLLAAELGVLTVRLERAIRSLDNVARVHVNRWGDGAAHLHVWFMARPTGWLQLRGTFLSMWDDILPPVPERQWRENLAFVAAWLAEDGGRAIAEPPALDNLA